MVLVDLRKWNIKDELAFVRYCKMKITSSADITLLSSVMAFAYITESYYISDRINNTSKVDGEVWLK